MKKLLLLTGVSVLLQIPDTLAGTLMEYYATPSFEDERGDLDVYIGEGHILFSGKARDGTSYKVIYDDVQRRFTVVDGGNKTFKRYLLKTFNSIHRIRAEYKADLEEKLAETDSEETRQAYREVSQILEERNLGGKPGQAPEYERVGETKSLGGRECVVHEVKDTKGALDRVLCMSEFASSDIPEQDIQLIKRMSETALRIVTAVEWAGYGLPRIALDFDQGLPAEIEYEREGEENLTLTLTTISDQELDEGLFDIPEEYTELPVKIQKN